LGPAGDDTIRGGDGDDIVFGQGGDDVIDGDDGNDKLFGGAGRDTIHGGNGNDRIFGGSGRDSLDGGPGRDKVKKGGHDRDADRDGKPGVTIDIFNKNSWLHQLVADTQSASREIDPNTSLWLTFGGSDSDGGSDGHSDGGTDDRSD